MASFDKNLELSIWIFAEALFWAMAVYSFLFFFPEVKDIFKRNPLVFVIYPVVLSIPAYFSGEGIQDILRLFFFFIRLYLSLMVFIFLIYILFFKN